MPTYVYIYYAAPTTAIEAQVKADIESKFTPGSLIHDAANKSYNVTLPEGWTFPDIQRQLGGNYKHTIPTVGTVQFYPDVKRAAPAIVVSEYGAMAPQPRPSGGNSGTMATGGKGKKGKGGGTAKERHARSVKNSMMPAAMRPFAAGEGKGTVVSASLPLETGMGAVGVPAAGGLKRKGRGRRGVVDE